MTTERVQDTSCNMHDQLHIIMAFMSLMRDIYTLPLRSNTISYIRTNAGTA